MTLHLHHVEQPATTPDREAIRMSARYLIDRGDGMQNPTIIDAGGKMLRLLAVNDRLRAALGKARAYVYFVENEMMGGRIKARRDGIKKASALLAEIDEALK